ncbi:MAG: nicotinamide-nucleotide amidohydrolase family protein [Deltaproteobacteria bacterium]|nr:nicotinamide-nucleotide amidohydrolase family protein [Deltaproteobacteria bacterium]
MIAAALTDVPGASDYFLEGCVTYSNEAKMRLLGVREETLEQHGAVSEQTAREMAEGLLARTGADIALSVTGIAGPGGGTPEKPVGTVHLAVASKDGETTAHVLRFPGHRDFVRKIATFFALNLLRQKVIEFL